MQPEEKSIGELAYRLWQSRGCPAGTAEQDWLDAEKQLCAMRSTAGQPSTQTAKLQSTKSDPPANANANADAKWKAAEVARKSPPRRSGRSNPNRDATR